MERGRKTNGSRIGRIKPAEPNPNPPSRLSRPSRGAECRNSGPILSGTICIWVLMLIGDPKWRRWRSFLFLNSSESKRENEFWVVWIRKCVNGETWNGFLEAVPFGYHRFHFGIQFQKEFIESELSHETIIGKDWWSGWLQSKQIQEMIWKNSNR